MKRIVSAILAAGLLAAPAMAQVPVTTTPPVNGTPVVGGTPGAPVAGVTSRHPEMNAAMRHLEMAKSELMKAAHDYSGHRDQAMALINQAEQQIQTGMATQK